MSRALISLPIFFLVLFQSVVHAISLTGSNGRSVQFAGVLEAQPQGLVLLMTEGKEPMTVSWDKFDMVALEENHPKIYDAYSKATSYRKVVPLRLGVYSKYKCYDQVLSQLANDFNKPYTVPVPSYEEYIEAYNRLYFDYGGARDYYDHAKDRRKIYNKYREFIDLFFSGQNIQLSVSSSMYSQNVFAAVPDKKQVKITPRSLVAFFAAKNNKSRKEAIVYIHNYKDVIKQPLEILRKTSKEVPSPLFDRSNPDEAYLESLLVNNIKELEHLSKEKTFPHSALRNFEKLLAVLDEGSKQKKK